MTRRLPTKQLLQISGRTIHVLKNLEKLIHLRWPRTFEVAKRGSSASSGRPSALTRPFQCSFAAFEILMNMWSFGPPAMLKGWMDRLLMPGVAFDLLEHFRKDEALAIADEVYRVLAPGGAFILHLPNGEGFLAGSTLFGDLTHDLILTSDSLGQLLRGAGLKDVRTFEDVPTVHGPASAMRYIVWAVVKCFLWIAFAAQTGNISTKRIRTQTFLAIATKP